MRTRDIYISAGHSNVAGRDRGAAANGHIEGVLAAELRRDMAAELKRRGLRVFGDGDNSILSETLTWMRNRTTNRCIVLDIHWNSAAIATATGTETLVPSDASLFELSLASEYSRVVSTTLGIPMRGRFQNHSGVRSEAESHHGRLGWMRLTGQNILSEKCFINNPNDMKAFFDNRNALTKNLCDLLERYAKTEIGIVATTSGVLNVRKLPSAEALRTGTLTRGATVFITDDQNGFYRVSNNVNTEGWASKQFIKLT